MVPLPSSFAHLNNLWIGENKGGSGPRAPAWSADSNLMTLEVRNTAEAKQEHQVPTCCDRFSLQRSLIQKRESCGAFGGSECSSDR